MADQPNVEEETPVDVAAVATREPNLLETTTVKDGSLPINVSAPTAPSSTVEPLVPAVPAVPVVTPPETPILVTESEVSPTPASNPGLAEEVESLSGEIQALEAKIDRLTGNVKPVVDSPPVVPAKEEASAKVNLPVKEETAPPSVSQPEEKSAEPAKTEPTPAPPSTPAPPDDKPATKNVSINDIYSKVGMRQKEADTASTSNTDEAEDVGSGSSIGTIGEVLAVFGVIVFMIMGGFPFYKSMLPESITEAVRSIGWPTAVVSLALGFLMSLFSHGKAATKIFTVIILLFAVVLYLGVAGFQSYLGPLGTMLDSVFSFYR